MYRFVTEYKVNQQLYGGHVDALDWEHAQQICDNNGRQEEVVGILFATVSASHWTEDEATRFMKDLADDNPEPPLASEFD